jgi:putative ABC transport system ATP-binding protein
MTVETAQASDTATAGRRRSANGGLEVRLEGVEKVYQTERIETVALSDIHLDVREGELISVMGPSGSGKSTLLNIMGLLDAPTAGRVLLGGQDTGESSERKLARVRNEDIGFIFQTFHLITDLNVIDNVQLPLLYRGVPAAERRRRATEALDRVDLSARRRHYPSQLSGGQQQRVAIARAFVGGPRMLLADEPTGNLDSQMGEEIMSLLEEYNREEGVTVVMVTHNQRLADRTGRIVRLFDGRQVE